MPEAVGIHLENNMQEKPRRVYPVRYFVRIHVNNYPSRTIYDIQYKKWSWLFWWDYSCSFRTREDAVREALKIKEVLNRPITDPRYIDV